jgi:hypothetical protein
VIVIQGGNHDGIICKLHQLTNRHPQQELPPFLKAVIKIFVVRTWVGLGGGPKFVWKWVPSQGLFWWFVGRGG